jgi:hypothetical protein
MEPRIIDFLNVLKVNGCSNPKDWQPFMSLLNSNRSPGNPPPPPPLILTASAESAASKHRRIREQLVWAAANNCLAEALHFLQGLPSDAWETTSEQDWFKDSYPTW